MKTLSFDTTQKYEILYEGLSVAECGYKGIQIRLVNRIFEKLEGIGKPINGAKGYTLSKGLPDSLDDALGFIYPSIELEDEEFALVLSSFDSVTWTAVGARAAAKVYDWLHSIK